MKYIDADKLRAEIERRMKELDEQIVDIYDSKAVLRKDELQRLLSFLDTLEEPVEKTCKTCGFYENNCPFIRDKFIPYPNKVCKDYTFSTLKAEQEPVSDDLEDEIKKFIEEYGYERGEDKLLIAIVARHFAQWGADHFRDTTKMIEPEKKEGEQ